MLRSIPDDLKRSLDKKVGRSIYFEIRHQNEKDIFPGIEQRLRNYMNIQDSFGQKTISSYINEFLLSHHIRSM